MLPQILHLAQMSERIICWRAQLVSIHGFPLAVEGGFLFFCITNILHFGASCCFGCSLTNGSASALFCYGCSRSLHKIQSRTVRILLQHSCSLVLLSAQSPYEFSVPRLQFACLSRKVSDDWRRFRQYVHVSVFNCLEREAFALASLHFFLVGEELYSATWWLILISTDLCSHMIISSLSMSGLCLCLPSFRYGYFLALNFFA